MFQNFHRLVKNQLDKIIKTLQADWGREAKALVSYLNEYKIVFRRHCLHAHKQNRKAERKHKHIIELGLVLLSQTRIPLNIWCEDFQTFISLINRLSSSIISNLTPY